MSRRNVTTGVRLAFLCNIVFFYVPNLRRYFCFYVPRHRTVALLSNAHTTYWLIWITELAFSFTESVAMPFIYAILCCYNLSDRTCALHFEHLCFELCYAVSLNLNSLCERAYSPHTPKVMSDTALAGKGRAVTVSPLPEVFPLW